MLKNCLIPVCVIYFNWNELNLKFNTEVSSDLWLWSFVQAQFHIKKKEHRLFSNGEILEIGILKRELLFVIFAHTTSSYGCYNSWLFSFKSKCVIPITKLLKLRQTLNNLRKKLNGIKLQKNVSLLIINQAGAVKTFIKKFIKTSKNNLDIVYSTWN